MTLTLLLNTIKQFGNVRYWTMLITLNKRYMFPRLRNSALSFSVWSSDYGKVPLLCVLTEMITVDKTLHKMNWIIRYFPTCIELSLIFWDPTNTSLTCRSCYLFVSSLYFWLFISPCVRIVNSFRCSALIFILPCGFNICPIWCAFVDTWIKL